jgi:eukaryotic-like serine/threonine-protein kinase
MADPRVPESALRDTIDGIDELEFIDRGGQGDAWRLRRGGGGDEVLKVIVGADLARVRREVAVLRVIQDDNVMRFIETTSAQHGGATYPLIIGEYVAGGSVASRLQADDWPTEREALETVIGVLRGLAAIHAHEIVHRDIKPGNIALRDDRWSDPVILDFGLVRDLLGSSITVYPNLLGTVPFMAPEQLRKERAVRRSDVFAVGVTLFLLLTKQHPFIEATEQEIAIEVLEERVRDDDRPRWDQMPGIADDVREPLERMLMPDAFQRPRAAAAGAVFESVLKDR